MSFSLKWKANSTKQRRNCVSSTVITTLNETHYNIALNVSNAPGTNCHSLGARASFEQLHIFIERTLFVFLSIRIFFSLEFITLFYCFSSVMHPSRISSQLVRFYVLNFLHSRGTMPTPNTNQRWKRTSRQQLTTIHFTLDELNIFYVEKKSRRERKKSKKLVPKCCQWCQIKITILWGSHSIMQQIESQSYQFTHLR